MKFFNVGGAGVENVQATLTLTPTLPPTLTLTLPLPLPLPLTLQASSVCKHYAAYSEENWHGQYPLP